MRYLTRYFTAAIAFATAMALGLGSGVAARTNAKSMTASGTFTGQSDLFSGTSGTVAEISQSTYKGAITGVAIIYGTASFQSGGSYSGKGTEYCAACSIAGKSGAFTATYKYSGSGRNYTATLSFTHGFGKLAGLTGGGTFKGNLATNSNTYDYHYTLP